MRNNIDHFLKLFANRQDAYYVQASDHEGNFAYFPVWETLDATVGERHLNGEITLGFPALGPGNLCKWGCWDFDTKDGARDRVDEFLSNLKLVTLREGGREGKTPDQNRDGHLWLLLEPPIPASDLRLFATEIAAHCQLEKVEFFPKQSKEHKLANPVRAPLGIHRKPGANNARGWFDAAPTDIQSQLEWLEAVKPNHSAVVSRIAAELQVLEKFKISHFRKTVDDSDLAVEFAELEPELKGDYYECRCPACGQRRAYFYRGGEVLLCNRLNNCGFKISVEVWIKQRGVATGSPAPDDDEQASSSGPRRR